MIFNMVSGSLNSLNFTVVGGTVQPSNPAVNTIWVNTSTEITGWVISPVQPAGSNGLVWIEVGDSSQAAFNALSENNITLYLITARQYVGGIWQDKTCKSYIGGKWVELTNSFEIPLNSASLWSAQQFAGSGGTATVSNGVLTLKSGEIASSNGMTYPPGFETIYQQSVSLSEYKTMEVEMNLTKTSDQEISLRILNNKTASSATVLATYQITPIAGTNTYTLDISGVSSGYPCIRWYDKSANGTIKITRVRFVG